MRATVAAVMSLSFPGKLSPGPKSKCPECSLPCPTTSDSIATERGPPPSPALEDEERHRTLLIRAEGAPQTPSRSCVTHRVFVDGSLHTWWHCCQVAVLVKNPGLPPVGPVSLPSSGCGALGFPLMGNPCKSPQPSSLSHQALLLRKASGRSRLRVLGKLQQSSVRRLLTKERGLG